MHQEKKQLVLKTLSALANNPSMSQRSLAKHLNVALGGANAHMQYCIRSGFVRKSITGRTGYQITEKGWDIRRKITAESYTEQLHFNRKLSEEYRTLISKLAQRGFQSFLIYGTNEMSDIAYVAAQAMNVKVDGFINNNMLGESYLNTPVVADASNLLPQQAILFTEIDDAQNTFNTLAKEAGRRRIAVPEPLQDLISTKDLTL